MFSKPHEGYWVAFFLEKKKVWGVLYSSLVNWYQASFYFAGSGRTWAGSKTSYHSVDNFSITKTGVKFERQTGRLKHSTVNNLLWPLVLPLQGHVMARATGCGSHTCHWGSARSGHTGPAGTRTADPDGKQEAAGWERTPCLHLPEPLIPSLACIQCFLYCWSYRPRVSRCPSPTWGTENGTSSPAWPQGAPGHHLSMAGSPTGSGARCKGPAGQRGESTNLKFYELGKQRQICLMSAHLLIQLLLLLVLLQSKVCFWIYNFRYF